MNCNGIEGASEGLLYGLHIHSEGNDNQVRGLKVINLHHAWLCN